MRPHHCPSLSESSVFVCSRPRRSTVLRYEIMAPQYLLDIGFWMIKQPDLCCREGRSPGIWSREGFQSFFVFVSVYDSGYTNSCVNVHVMCDGKIQGRSWFPSPKPKDLGAVASMAAHRAIPTAIPEPSQGHPRVIPGSSQGHLQSPPMVIPQLS